MKLEPLHELIIDFIEKTNRPIFMTGKAGTGKTTFLQHIRASVKKNLAVVAPTAVAAINAGGVTIHSFFQVPFGPTLPSTDTSAFSDLVGTSFSAEKAKIIKCLDLLIIDEISMVRADTMDYIDRVLRFVKGNNSAFGGIQLLMIGDLYQLSPVYQNDWHLLKRFYSGPYFFDSLAFKKQPMLTFELTKVHRQKDPTFIELLNSIRNGAISDVMLDKLNEHHKPVPKNEDLAEYVTLTTHNPLVKEINELRLNELPGTTHQFKATVTGDFPKEAFPTEEELVLKEGALVMFIRNDTSGKKQFYNGRTAKITSINGDTIKVSFMDDNTEFEATRETWENTKYALSEADGKISENSAGSFSQFPLRLAWAITIHKSQGLTFDKAIIDVGAAFAHGQTYVALSRCRNLDGLILKERVTQKNIITDPTVTSFMKRAQLEMPNQQTLLDSISAMPIAVLEEVFDFGSIKAGCNHLKQVLSSQFPLIPSITEKIESSQRLLEEKISNIGERFIRQELKLNNQLSTLSLATIKDRLTKASAYFLPHLTQVQEQITAIHLLREGSVFDPEYFPTLNHLLEQLQVKINLFNILPTANITAEIIAVTKNVAMQYKPLAGWDKKETPKELVIENPVLYEVLNNWRTRAAEQKKLATYHVLSDQVMADISAKLPKSLKQLSMIKNFGEGKTTAYGEEILKLIRMHLGENELFF